MYKEHFDAVLEAWNTGDLDVLDEYVAENFRRIGPKTINSSANNLTDLKQLITEFRESFPDLDVRIDELRSTDDRSFCQWTFTGTNTGPGDLPPTGKRVELSGASISRYENNKMVEDCVYLDVLEFMNQLGHIELPAEGKTATA